MLLTPSLRIALADDERFLLQMLFYAAHADEEPGVTPEQLLAKPMLARYVVGYGKPGDFGVVAVAEGRAIGAAWVRLMAGEERGYGWVADDTPELAIATLPEAIGSGVGSAMLREVIARSRAVYPAISLSVRADNPARRLYRRFGFEAVSEVTNRVGGKSETMIVRFG